MTTYVPKLYKKLFFDLETTGLDANKHGILEVGAILVDDELRVISRLHALVTDTKRHFELPKVQEMHEKNGLLNDLAASDAGAWEGVDEADLCIESSLAQVDVLICKWLMEHGAQPGQIVLCGESIHFDRGFVDVHLKQLSWLLSHRLRDYSGMWREMADAGVNIPDRMNPDKFSSHRALADAESVLLLARWLRGKFKDIAFDQETAKQAQAVSANVPQEALQERSPEQLHPAVSQPLPVTPTTAVPGNIPRDTITSK